MTKVVYKRLIEKDDFLDDSEIIYYKDSNIAFIIVEKDNNYFIRKKKVFNNQQIDEVKLKTIPQIIKYVQK